jgi:hypothetical protein
MPANSGIRFRPPLGLSRPISARRLRIGHLTQALPRAIMVPLVALAFVTAMTAVFWTNSIHNADTVASIEAPATTGSVSKAN